MSRLTRASPRTSATRPIEERRHVDASLQQRPGNHETVAAVVAAAAEHCNGPSSSSPHRLDRGDDLPPGILHEDDEECRCLRSCADRPRASGARRGSASCRQISTADAVGSASAKSVRDVDGASRVPAHVFLEQFEQRFRHRAGLAVADRADRPRRRRAPP